MRWTARAFATPALALALLAAPTPAVGDDDAPNAFAAAWREVPLPLALLRTHLNDRRCRQGRAAFEACLLALAEISIAHEPPWVPVPHADEVGVVAWREAALAPDAGRYQFGTRVAREFQVIARWRDRSVDTLRADRALRELEANVIGEHNRAELVARAFGALLRRGVDPHTAIAPYPAVDRALRGDSRGHRPDLRFRGSRDPDSRGGLAEQLFARGYRLGRIRLSTVEDTACSNVSEALAYLTWRGIEALVLDLRGNVGGVADQAACIADLFLPRATPLLRLEALVGDFDERQLDAKSARIFDRPIAVLIDSQSASGAEVIAAILQARERALVIGERSFGKGTYQRGAAWPYHPEVVYFESVARLVVPPGYEFQGHGVHPDLAVPPPDATQPVLREDNSYVNPIAPRYPSIPKQGFPELDACLREQGTSPEDEDPVLETAKRALWCQLRGARTLGLR